ncbi:MAG: TonB-dependent receptor [Cyclobacteriaceae bacterium]|nr:TonB-dependent receptor [Cyclobacteriaceae bacterium]
MKQTGLLSILLLSTFFYSLTSRAQKHTVSGYIKDKNTGEVLIGANIYTKPDLVGTTSNTFGFYSLTLPEDSVQIVFSFVGYVPVTSTIFLDRDLEMNIGLSSSIELDEIVVTAEEDIQQQSQMSSITVPVKQIQKLPALMGEVDVLKVLQLLPGVQSGSEGSSGLYVRGGGPDQNLILLDGVPVYNASHLFGFFSVFNADAINNVELIKGGFPARYGGRLSSVIDISMKEGNTKEFKGTATIGLIASKITLEGPIKNENTSFLVSARRTYIDLLARPIIKAANDGEVTAGYYFYDLNAKLNHKFSNKDRLFFSGFLGEDKAYSKDKSSYSDPYGDYHYAYDDEFGLKWGNMIGAIRWNHLFTPKLFSNVTATYSRYKFKVFEESNSSTTGPSGTTTDNYAIAYNSGINDWAAKIDFDFIPSPNHYIRFGVNGIQHHFNPGVLSYRSAELDTVAGSFEKDAFEFASYIEDDFKVIDALKLNAGLHFSGFNVDGKTYYSFQPRVSLRYLIRNGIALKASYAQMAQYIHLLTNSGIGLPTDLWVPSTNKIEPQFSTQYAIGAAKTLNKTYEVSIEGYYKEMKNLIEYKDGASFTSVNKDWQDKVEVGNGRSYGVELFAQKKLGKLTGWVGYTLSWTDRQFDNINFGKRFPYRYDRRHDISITSVYKLSDHVELAGAWVFGTGNAVSLPNETYMGTDESLNNYYYSYQPAIDYYDGRNGFRMKNYHRLDFSISWTKQKKNGIRRLTLGVYNVYNHKNPFFMELSYDYQTQKNKFVQYSLMPIIPSISYRFDF